MLKTPNLQGHPDTLFYNDGNKVSYVSPSKNLVGLDNVDNTSDANKPISNATQVTLNLKENTSNKATTLVGANNTTYPTTKAVEDALFNAQLGLIFQEPVETPNLVANLSTPPVSPVDFDVFIVDNGGNTGVWSAFLPGDLVQFENGNWDKLKSLAVGDRLGVAFVTNTPPSNAIAGQKDKIATITGGTPGNFIYSFQTPLDDFALLIDNPNAYLRNQVFVYSDELVQWVKVSGGIDLSFTNGFNVVGNVVETDIQVTDTNTLNLTSNGYIISGDVKISTSPNNVLTQDVNGLFVPLGSETPLVATDSQTIDFTTSGTNGHNLTGSVKISATPGNDISTNPDGLYIDVQASETNTTLNQDILTGVITYTNEDGLSSTANVVSSEINNDIIVGADGGAYLDLTAGAVSNVPSGRISSGDVQSAINELDTEKTQKFRTVLNLVAGNNVINHNLSLPVNSAIVDIRSNTNGSVIQARITNETNNSITINVPVATSNVRVTVIG